MEPESPRPPAPERSNWHLRATLGGVAAALQIGKAAASLPLIRDEFGASLTLLSAYVALISLVGAAGGVAFGTLARRIGPRPVGLAGLVLVTAGSATGALSGSVEWLIATRFLEAIGFALVVTTMPALIQAQAAPRDRGLALGIWSTWMPTGIATMMVIGYFGLGPLGWRGIFWICAALPAAAALLLTLASGPVGSAGPRAVGLSFRVLRDRNVIDMAGIFICFSAAFLLVMTFLPTILVDTLSFTPPTAALVGFAASLALLPANVSAGWLIGRGASAALIFTVSLTGMLVTAAVLFAPALGATVCVAAAVLFGLASGAPTAVIWASIPRLAQRPEDAPLLSGSFFQAAGIGQVLGPLIGGAAVDGTGHWSAALWVAGTLLVLCILLAFRLRRR
jgi:MFS family permease